ncbi:efflux RND transporter periplasmic adaptor subunit [Pelagerythrobacter rhizovicinus]|uniref:Efflux RND transporter periplasmic adaptor subunit n=1 Tax=Pelagerythrobacter rhizovicinus TaxID=2268576 RepID=A0A4V1QWL7_9SPHN|nr:efflux RND transporter periplasmic adaptor subunit [Pelagerythrobacter rhizovicinus]RXZ66596.1 efflux RND transporter periplasmic adaptor subunit [Pelagerythrobacter rhizovicinus]
MARKKTSRFYLTVGAAVLLVLLLIYAFWPSATMVDMGTVTQGPMQLTIDEEGRTRVDDSYAVSAPAAGRLQRVEVEPGDRVIGGRTVVARLLPAPLDPRARAQARAGVAMAEASLRAAREEAARAAAERELAANNLAREQKLWELDSTSREALETARRDAATAAAAAGAANATISSRRAELERARAELSGGGAIAIFAPASGRVLSVEQESETTLAAGAPIMEVGNIDGDLEVLVELLSTDAVQVSPGDRVLIDNWGGGEPLEGEVARIEPQGFTKVSALGVEEQRVNTIVRLTDPRIGQIDLGSGFRVEARIVVWEDDDAIIVPSSALFREQGDWAVFVVADGEAERRAVRIGRNNGTQAQVIEGLNEGETVILYPAAEITDGTSVERRNVE